MANIEKKVGERFCVCVGIDSLCHQVGWLLIIFTCLYSPDSTMTNRKEVMCYVIVICIEKLCILSNPFQGLVSPSTK